MYRTSVGWVALLLAGCSFADEAHWSDQLAPNGPCWDVDLADGLDEAATDELHSLFDCLNQSGNFEPLSPLDDALDAPNRNGGSNGKSVAALVNALADNGVAMLGWAGDWSTQIEASIEEAAQLMDATVETIYGRPTPEDLPPATDTQHGLVVPALLYIQQLASSLLDGGDAVRVEVAQLSDSVPLHAAGCTAVLAAESAIPEVADLPRMATHRLSDAWTRAQDSTNNRRPSATGNSIRDLVHWVQLGNNETVLHPVQAELFSLFSDEQVSTSVKRVLQDADANGHLSPLPRQLLYLATVNASGNPLTGTRRGDLSVLESSMRMLARANREMECTIPIVGFEVELGNLSVEILRSIADSDSGEFIERLDLLEQVWGFGITQVVIETLAASGACAGIDQDLIDDMEVIERLNDPDVEELALVVHGLLNAVYEDGSHDRLQETVDLAAFLHTTGALPLLEEVLRDLALSELTGTLIDAVPLLLRPESLLTGSCPGGGSPLSFDHIWEMAMEASTPGPPSLLRQAIGDTLVGASGVWVTLDRAAALGQHNDAAVHHVIPVVLAWARQPGPSSQTVPQPGWAANELVYTHSLRVLENADVHAAITDTRDGTNVLHFVAELIVSDTVTVMLQTLNMVFDSLGFERSNTD